MPELIKLLIAGGISIIEAIKEGIAAGKIKPADIQGLLDKADDLKAKRDAAMDEWNALAPDGD